MDSRPLMVRYPRAFAAIMATLFLMAGWESHCAKIYAAAIYHKAEICDSIQCEKVIQLSEDLKEYTLPALKGQKK
jgi:hypothetical protein